MAGYCCWFGLVWWLLADWLNGGVCFCWIRLVVLVCLVLPLRICLGMLGFGCSVVLRVELCCCFIVMYCQVGFVWLLICFGCVVNSVVTMCSFILVWF